jgi:RNA polymerase sigma-70 factor, ECF subfamily
MKYSGLGANLFSEADVEPQFCSVFSGQPMILMSSFDEIYERHVKAVFRVALRAVSRREIAEEITSEVFLALHQNWEHIDHEQLPAWLFTVAKRRAADYWRRWYLEDRWALAPQEEQVWQEPEIPLPNLLAKCPNLKPIHRTCIILRFVHGMSREEIASQTSLSELQVKGHLQYALKLLRETIRAGRTQLSAPGEVSADA